VIGIVGGVPPSAAASVWKWTWNGAEQSEKGKIKDDLEAIL